MAKSSQPQTSLVVSGDPRSYQDTTTWVTANECLELVNYSSSLIWIEYLVQPVKEYDSFFIFLKNIVKAVPTDRDTVKIARSSHYMVDEILIFLQYITPQLDQERDRLAVKVSRHDDWPSPRLTYTKHGILQEGTFAGTRSAQDHLSPLTA